MTLLRSLFHYSILIWIIILGFVVFGDFPDGWSLIGMAVIVLCGLYIANRHRFAARS